MNFNPMQYMMNLAIQKLQSSPEIANSPQGQEFLTILQSGDVARGQQMADNFCKSYGVTREQAIQQASQHFKFPF